MAEGGYSTSIKDSSDAYFNILCTPCGEDNIREEAVKYCPECQEHLCSTCTRHHGRQKATRSHMLQASNTVKHSPMGTKTTKCRYHPDRNIEMYCGTHDMVYCTKCIAKEHRSCNVVIDVEDVKLPASTKRELQLLQTAMKSFQHRFEHIDKKTQKNIGLLENQRREIAEKIEDVERKFIEHIRKLKHEAVNNLKKEYVKLKSELNSTASEVDEKRTDIEVSSKKIRGLQNMDARQQFIQMKLIQNTLNDAGTLLAESEAKGIKALCFTENTDLKSTIMSSTSLGRVYTDRDQRTAPELYKVKSKKEINIKMKNDRCDCYLSDMCQLPDGTIILADGDNQKIKRLDMNYNIKDHCDVNARPTGICCTGQNEVAVKKHNNKVQFISVGRSLSKLKQITIEGGDGYLGMTYCAGELWISTENDVNVYNTFGTLLKTISKRKNGQDIFKSSPQHMAVSGETVIVTDYSNGAVCLGRDGTVTGELHDERLAGTTGVCVSGDGAMFLVGYLSNNIVMFDKNGKCFGELVAKDSGLFKPVSLCYDDRRNCFIVISALSDKIVIFNI